MNDYIQFSGIINRINTYLQLQYTDKKNPSKKHKGISVNGKLPVSINEIEFNFIKSTIQRQKLQRCFELGTGNCISTLAIGMGLKECGGKLISFDSYIEHDTQDVPISPQQIETSNRSFNNNKNIIKLFDLQNIVQLYKGWSPQDCIKEIDRQYKDLDFVFLDCPKSNEDFKRDIEYILPRLNKDKYLILIHDIHCFVEEFITTAQVLKQTPVCISDFAFPHIRHHQYYPLGLISNITI